jgi:hypothetical protein
MSLRAHNVSADTTSGARERGTWVRAFGVRRSSADQRLRGGLLAQNSEEPPASWHPFELVLALIFEVDP